MNTWNLRQTGGAIAVAAVIAVAGGAAIAAAAASGGHDMFDGGMRGPGGPPPGAFSARQSDSLHGERVIADGRGGFTILLEQTGRVTAISPASVTVRSDDAFVQTYVIRTAGPAVAVGDDVTVAATREGEAAVIDTMRPPLSTGRFG